MGRKRASARQRRRRSAGLYELGLPNEAWVRQRDRRTCDNQPKSSAAAERARGEGVALRLPTSARGAAGATRPEPRAPPCDSADHPAVLPRRNQGQIACSDAETEPSLPRPVKICHCYYQIQCIFPFSGFPQIFISYYPYDTSNSA